MNQKQPSIRPLALKDYLHICSQSFGAAPRQVWLALQLRQLPLASLWQHWCFSDHAIDAQRAKKVISKCSTTRELLSAGRVLSSPKDRRKSWPGEALRLHTQSEKCPQGTDGVTLVRPGPELCCQRLVPAHPHAQPFLPSPVLTQQQGAHPAPWPLAAERDWGQARGLTGKRGIIAFAMVGFNRSAQGLWVPRGQ